MSEFSKNNSQSMSEDIRALIQALLIAMKDFSATGLNTKGHNYRYAKLNDIYAAVENALRINNIKIIHYRETIVGTTIPDDRELIITRLIHGPTCQYIQDSAFIISEKPGNQGRGSAATYMKRYAVLNLCGIAQEEGDDDGTEEQYHLEEKLITKEQHHELNKLLSDIGQPKNLTIWKKLLGFNKIKDLAELKQSQFEGAYSFILKERDKPNGTL